jgi:transcriptional regulator with XRE-family HTH domain
METHQIIRHYRDLRGLTIKQLAKEVGVSDRQIARYEDPEDGAQPSLPIASKLAATLDISLATLAGHGAPTVNLSGEWWTAWQTWMNDEERVEVEFLRIHQEGNFLLVTGSPDPAHEATGSFSWTGELRLIRDRCLSGWYVATTDGVASNGAIHLTLDPQGHVAVGRWMGLSHDGINECGWGSMARDRETAEAALEALLPMSGTLKAIPEFEVKTPRS